MLNQGEMQLMKRCAGYLDELAELYHGWGCDDRQIWRDLEKIEQIAKDATKSNPPFPQPTRPSHTFGSCRARHANDERWADDVETAYSQHGGRARHSAIYRTVQEIRTAAGRSWPSKARETIRQTLQAHNAMSPQYRGGDDLFRMVRRGLWRLKDHKIH